MRIMVPMELIIGLIFSHPAEVIASRLIKKVMINIVKCMGWTLWSVK